MEDFKLEREEGSEWSEEPRKQRRDRMQMHKTPILQLFRLENDLDRIVEYESQDLITTASRKIHHKECVSIYQHKNTTNKLQLKLKAKEHKEI